jgi:hypothetical protein
MHHHDQYMYHMKKSKYYYEKYVYHMEKCWHYEYPMYGPPSAVSPSYAPPVSPKGKGKS